MEKDYTLFGTKVIDNETNEVCLVLSTWDNVYADAVIPFVTIVNKKGKVKNTRLDYTDPVEEVL